MTRFMLGVLGSALLLVAPTTGAAPSKLDADALKATRGFLSTLAKDLQDTLTSSEGAKERLLERGKLPEDLAREMSELTRLAREAGGATAARFNSFTLHGTVWFGPVPLREVELHMVVTPDRVRLMRAVVRPTRMRVFGHPTPIVWTDPPAQAFGALTRQMIAAMTGGDCDALPRILPGDHKALLPAKSKARANTLAVFDRFDRMVDQACEALDKVPHHATTWRFGELGGVVVTEGARNVPFKLTMTHDGQGAPKIFHLRGSPPRR